MLNKTQYFFNALTANAPQCENTPIAFNQAMQPWKAVTNRQAAVILPLVQKRYFLRLQTPFTFALLVNRGQGAIYRAATVWQFSTPCPLFATRAVEKFGVALKNQTEKVHSLMTTITKRAHTSRKISHNPTHRATHAKRVLNVLTVQTVRHFPTLEQASSYINHRAHQSECYALHQSTSQRWTVSRVLGDKTPHCAQKIPHINPN